MERHPTATIKVETRDMRTAYVVYVDGLPGIVHKSLSEAQMFCLTEGYEWEEK